jgi:hypothetical protein
VPAPAPASVYSRSRRTPRYAPTVRPASSSEGNDSDEEEEEEEEEGGGGGGENARVCGYCGHARDDGNARGCLYCANVAFWDRQREHERAFYEALVREEAKKAAGSSSSSSSSSSFSKSERQCAGHKRSRSRSRSRLQSGSRGSTVYVHQLADNLAQYRRGLAKLQKALALGLAAYHEIASKRARIV